MESRFREIAHQAEDQRQAGQSTQDVDRAAGAIERAQHRRRRRGPRSAAACSRSAAPFRSSRKSRVTARASGLPTSASWSACTIPPPSISPRPWSRSAISGRRSDSKRYRVGRPLFALAASALDEIEMVNLATPVLEDLSRETGESGHFAVRMGDAVVVIARTSGPGAFQLTDRVGVVRPAHCTALGKIILASLRPDQLKRFLERVELKPSTKKSITDHAGAAARNRRDPAQRRSPSTTANSIAEVRCVAVPVYDFTGEVIGALGISGPIWRMSDQALQSRAKLVQAAAGRLSAEFGARDLAKSS